MRLTKWLAFSLLASSLSVAACSGAEAGPAVSAGQAASDDPSSAAHLGLVREALDKVALRPDQKAEVEKLTQAAKARHEAVRTAHVDLRNAIADQVLAGRIDRAALKPKTDAVLAAIDAARPEDRAAIVRLHDVLDAGQRSELVSSIEDSFRARREARKGHGGPRQWAADLNLTDAQRDQLRAVLGEQFHREGAGLQKWQAAHEEGRRLLHSFREEKFALDGQAKVFGSDRIERGIDRMLGLAEAALPILKPEQRAIAAQKIREGRHGMH